MPGEPSERTSREEVALRNQEMLERALTPLVLTALADPDVIEILANPDGRVYVEKLGDRPREVGYLPPSRVMGAISAIAHMQNTVISIDRPRLECAMRFGGHRFSAQIPPIVDSPAYCIRKRASRVFTLEDFAEQGVMQNWHVDVLRQAVRDRKNIVVAGGTASGKTTLLNGIIHAMAETHPHDRFISAEDTRELQCRALNLVFMQTTETVSMRDVVKMMLRMRPDRIICGEVRDGAMFELLKAWNTGHPGGAVTLHANDVGVVSLDAPLRRIENLVSEATLSNQGHLIGEAVDFVVNVKKDNFQRRVTSIIRCDGWSGGEYQVSRLGPDAQGRLQVAV